MISKEHKEQLINEFVKNMKSSAGKADETKKPKPKVASIPKKEDAEGNTTWGDLTGETNKYSDIKTHKYEDTDWPEYMRGWIPKVDSNYVYDLSFFRLALPIDQGIVSMAVGNAGSGKDAAAKQYCALKRIPYKRITGMAGITPDMVLGAKGLDDTGVTWIPGDAHLICRDGGMLVISEPASMPADVMFAFQSALESGGYLSLVDHPDPNERMLPVNKHTRFVMTSNVRGVGDNAHLYSAATNVLDASFLNRVGATVQFKYLNEDAEVSLIKRHFPTIGDDLAKRVVKFGNLIRQGFDTGNIEFEWSARSFLPWIRMSLILGDVAEGMHATFFDKLSDDEKGVVRGLWKTAGFEETL